jgi:hypothetical protein
MDDENQNQGKKPDTTWWNHQHDQASRFFDMATSQGQTLWPSQREAFISGFITAVELAARVGEKVTGTKRSD